jgi:hypothetical protein
MPPDIKTRLIEGIETQLSRINLTGLERPEIHAGSVGPDARSLGAASLPLSEKYLVEA